MQICRQVQKLLINQSGYRRVPFWEIGLRKFVSHTTVIQQLQFKMPETAIKHNIWPLKSIGFEQNNAWSTQFWWKPKINIFGMQIENHCILYCERVSVRLILGGRVTFTLVLPLEQRDCRSHFCINYAACCTVCAGCFGLRRAAGEGLGVTLMERVMKAHGDSVVRMLTTQYRMHQDIMLWSSQQLYQSRLQAHPSVATHLLRYRSLSL